MGDPTTKRIFFSTGMLVGGAILICPAFGAGAAGVAIGSALVGAYGSVLGTDVHNTLSKGKLDTSTNHDLQKLTGRALAILIERYQNEQDPPTKFEKLRAFLRRPRGEFHELAAVAEEGWDNPDLTGKSEPLKDTDIHKLFLEHDRVDKTPVISADEWDKHLQALAERAQKKNSKIVWARYVNRRPLAEYIAANYMFVVRELVKADFDPNHGTGGRVFVALHLDMMRALSISIRQIDRTTAETLKLVKDSQDKIDALSNQVIDALDSDQKQGLIDLVVEVLDQHIQTRQLIQDGFTRLEAGQALILEEIRKLNELLALRLSFQQAQTPTLPQIALSFVGRATEIDDLRQALIGDTNGPASGTLVGIAGVQGQGGIGKTALALHVLNLLADEGRYPDGQAYINLRGTDSKPDQVNPRQAMENLLRQFDPEAVFKDATDEQLAAHYRAALSQKQAVLLLDNAAAASQITSLIPGGSCAAFFTARQRFRVGQVTPLALDVLSPEDAAELAQQIAPCLTENQAAELAEACGRLALAIRLAAKRIDVYDDVSPADHLDKFKANRLAYLDRVQREQNKGHESLPFVNSVIELSLKGLNAPELEAFWTRLSVFPGDFNSTLGSLVASEDMEPDIEAGQDMLSELRRHTLLEFDAESKRYSLHDLTREYAQTRVLDATARSALAKRHAAVFMSFLGLADRAYLDGKPLEGLAMLDAEMPSVLAGQAWATTHLQTDDDAGRLAAKYYDAGAYVLSLRLHSRTQIAWLETAVAACRKLGDRRGEGNALGNLGLAHADLGDARKAIEFYEQRIVIAREIGDRRGEGKALGNLGLAHAQLGDARKAIEFYEQRIVIAREIGDRRGEGNVLGNLGLAHAQLGDARKAIEYHEQALVVSREIGDRRGEGNTLGNLGNAHADLGDARKAIEYHEQALVVSREIGDRRGEGQDLGNLGNAHADLGDARKAIEFYEQQLVIVREIGDRRGEGNALGNLGNAHARLGDARKAIEFYEQRIVIAREIGDRRGEGNALFNRAGEFAKQDAWGPAAEDMEQAAAIFAAIESPDADRAAQRAIELRRQADGNA